MKTHLIPLVVFSAVILLAAPASSAYASGLQKDTPGAQGTEGTNPTQQDSNVTGPNGEHSTNTNPAQTPASGDKSCSGGNCSSGK